MNQSSKPRLLGQVRHRCRTKHYSIRTEKLYTDWIRRFILFHGKRHPVEMEAKEVEAFLAHLAVNGNVAPSTQNQALAAILFLYKEVLEIELPWLDGVHRLIASLLYGSGLRLMEAMRLRIKDVGFERLEIIVRDGQGWKDRRTMLPQSLVEPLKSQFDRVRVFHAQNIHNNIGPVYLPYALERKYPNAGGSWAGS